MNYFPYDPMFINFPINIRNIKHIRRQYIGILVKFSFKHQSVNVRIIRPRLCMMDPATQKKENVHIVLNTS